MSELKLKVKYLIEQICINAIKVLWIFPVNNDKYLFLSYDGEQYSDSPRCISEVIHNNAPEKTVIWAFNEKLQDIPVYINQVNTIL